MRFDGKTFDPALDAERLESQLGRVYDLMIDGCWRTIYEIAIETKGAETSISARLRDLRKERFGAYRVFRRRRGDPHFGLFEYQLLLPLPKPTTIHQYDLAM